MKIITRDSSYIFMLSLYIVLYINERGGKKPVNLSKNALSRKTQKYDPKIFFENFKYRFDARTNFAEQKQAPRSRI